MPLRVSACFSLSRVLLLFFAGGSIVHFRGSRLVIRSSCGHNKLRPNGKTAALPHFLDNPLAAPCCSFPDKKPCILQGTNGPQNTDFCHVQLLDDMCNVNSRVLNESRKREVVAAPLSFRQLHVSLRGQSRASALFPQCIPCGASARADLSGIPSFREFLKSLLSCMARRTLSAPLLDSGAESAIENFPLIRILQFRGNFLRPTFYFP